MRSVSPAPMRIRASVAVAVALALALIGSLLMPVGTASAASTELVANGTFVQGARGWKLNDPARASLTTAQQGRQGSVAAVIEPSARGAVVLNDATDTVRRGDRGTKYTLTAWVRSTSPGAVSMVKAREYAGAQKYTHSSQVRLSGTGWQQVSVSFTSRFAQGGLDLNVLFWDFRTGAKLFVNSVSLTRVDSSSSTPTPVPSATSTPTPAPSATSTPRPTSTPTATPTQSPANPDTCTRPAPPAGTQFGSSISTNSTIWAADALADRDSIFGKIPVVRIWDPLMPFSWKDPRTEALKGRTLVMSFRPAPADVLSGKYDAQLRTWFEGAPSTSTIYWNYFHEPETPIDEQGQFTADIYRQAWRHIDEIADSVCRQNMYSTLVLMGYTTTAGSGRDWRDYYAGDDVIDVIAFDPYNGVHDVNRDYYASPSSMYDSVVRVASEAGKPWGLAETGSRRIPSDPTGSKRAAWLTAVADYTRTNGALFVTYFHSTNDGEWRLLDKPSQDAWRAAVASSPR